jgi:hypothetical protein
VRGNEPDFVQSRVPDRPIRGFRDLWAGNGERRRKTVDRLCLLGLLITLVKKA